MPISALAPASSVPYSFLREQNPARPAFGNGNGIGGNNAGLATTAANGSPTGTAANDNTGNNTNNANASSVGNAATDRVRATGGAAKSNNDDPSPANANGKADPTQLSDEDLALLAKLKSRDLEVRQHEAAHLAVAGGLATSGASFTYQKGPDGVNYAIGGEVGIDLSPGRTPEETIERARIVQAAALAPAQPSGPDLAVAAAAQQLQQQARAELAQQSRETGETGAVAATGVTDRVAGRASSGETPAAPGTGANANPPSRAEPTAAEAPQRAEGQREQLNRLYGVGNRTNSTPSLNIFA